MKNKKGSTIVWAITLIMVLVVIVGASLSFAYMSYNQSIKNRNKTQVEMIANSAIKSLVSAIENNQINVPTGTQPKKIASMELVDTSKKQNKINYGTISDIYIKNNGTDQALAYLTAHYAGEEYTVYAYLVKDSKVWKCVQYDTTGKSTIKVDSSGNSGGSSGGTGGNTGGGTGDNTGGNTGTSTTINSFVGNPKGSTQAEKVYYGVNTIINQYYADPEDTENGVKNIKAFNLWYKKQCEFMSNKYEEKSTWQLEQQGPLNEIYSSSYLKNSQLYELEDDIYQKAKNKNISIKNNTYVSKFYIQPRFIDNSSDFYLFAVDQSTINNSYNYYMVYVDGNWYTKPNGQIQFNEFASTDAIRTAISNGTLVKVE